jgi:hypothetical protein
LQIFAMNTAIAAEFRSNVLFSVGTPRTFLNLAMVKRPLSVLCQSLFVPRREKDCCVLK